MNNFQHEFLLCFEKYIVVFMIAIYLGLEDFIPKKFKKYSQDYAKSLLLGEISVGIQIDKKKVLQWFLKLMGKEIIARPDHSENDLSEKYNQAIRDLEISINFESIKQNFFDLILEINIEERTIISNMMDSPSFPKSLREFRSYLANWQRDIFLDIINLMFFGYENKQFPMKNYYQIVILNIMDVKKCFLGGKYYFCHPLNVNL